MRIEYIHIVTAQYSSNSVHFKQQGRFRRSCHVAVSDTYNSERSTFAGLFRFCRRLVLRKWTSAGVGMFLSPTLDQKNDQQNHSNHDQGTNNRRNHVSWVSSGAQQANQTRSMLTAWFNSPGSTSYMHCACTSVLTLSRPRHKKGNISQVCCLLASQQGTLHPLLPKE